MAQNHSLLWHQLGHVFPTAPPGGLPARLAILGVCVSRRQSGAPPDDRRPLHGAADLHMAYAKSDRGVQV